MCFIFRLLLGKERRNTLLIKKKYLLITNSMSSLCFIISNFYTFLLNTLGLTINLYLKLTLPCYGYKLSFVPI